jgi:hypothetical protein
MTDQTVREVSTGVSVKACSGLRIERKVVIVIGPGDAVEKVAIRGVWGEYELCSRCGWNGPQLCSCVDVVGRPSDDPQAVSTHPQERRIQPGRSLLLSHN